MSQGGDLATSQRAQTTHDTTRDGVNGETADVADMEAESGRVRPLSSAAMLGRLTSPFSGMFKARPFPFTGSLLCGVAVCARARAIRGAGSLAAAECAQMCPAADAMAVAQRRSTPIRPCVGLGSDA